MLILKRKAGEAVVFGECITVRILEIDGERVKLGIVAPPDVNIRRDELEPLVLAASTSAIREEKRHVRS